MQLTSVTSGVGTATKSVCVRVWRQGYVALDTRWVPTGVKEILKSIQVAFVCVCVCGGGGGGAQPSCTCMSGFWKHNTHMAHRNSRCTVKIITYHTNFRSIVKIMVLNVRLK